MQLSSKFNPNNFKRRIYIRFIYGFVLFLFAVLFLVDTYYQDIQESKNGILNAHWKLTFGVFLLIFISLCDCMSTCKTIRNDVDTYSGVIDNSYAHQIEQKIKPCYRYFGLED